MTDTPQEIMARKRCERHYMDRFNKPADDPHVIVNMVNWTDFLPECQRDVSALEDAGYAVVPVEATGEMWTAASNVMPNPRLWLASWRAAIATFQASTPED